MKSLASIEAFLALLLFLYCVSLLSRPSEKPAGFSTFYQFQLAQDFAEVSLADPQISAALKGFRNCGALEEKVLKEKYAEALHATGDYCLNVNVKGMVLQVNCDGAFTSRVSVSRMVFDGTGFFEADFSLSFR